MHISPEKVSLTKANQGKAGCWVFAAGPESLPAMREEKHALSNPGELREIFVHVAVGA